MAYIENSTKKPNLFSAITIGVGSIIGSGWLFASYKASKVAGTLAFGSWVIGAVVALLVALLLAEVATYYSKETGLFARMLSLTHNPDMGFIISSSNWFCTIIIIPAEAEASIQYLSQAYPSISDHIFMNNHFTALGIFFVCLTMIIYGLINFWGIKLFAKANNLITTFKLIVPAATALIFLAVSYHPENLTSYQHTISPYGYGKMFSAVVACGIFYSFYGFNTITFFSSELDNPQRNIPLALIGSIVICLIIYLLLQFSYLVALDPIQVATNGWDAFNFESPLAQLAILFGMNWMAIVLYVDAAISPSGTGIIFVGSSARIFTGMAKDGQMPKVFGNMHPKYGISRLSIITTLILCMGLVIFFDNWDKIMIVVSVFMAISCIAVPIAFVKLRILDNKRRPFTMPLGLIASYITYIAVTYLLTECGFLALVVSLGFHFALFVVYCSVYYGNVKSTINAFLSSWSLFAYLILTTILAYMSEYKTINNELIQFIILWVSATINYHLMINQKNYQK